MATEKDTKVDPEEKGNITEQTGSDILGKPTEGSKDITIEQAKQEILQKLEDLAIPEEKINEANETLQTLLTKVHVQTDNAVQMNDKISDLVEKCKLIQSASLCASVATICVLLILIIKVF